MASGMDQISLPFRIALVAMLVFAAAWLTVLRPHAAADTGADAPLAASSAPPTAPGAAGLERAVQKARGAAAAEGAAGAKAQAADPETPPAPARPAAPAPAKPAAPARARPASAAAVQPKTVLLFSGYGADSAAARSVVRSVRGRGVRTIIASLAELDRYRDLVGTVEITSAPTILVIGRDRTAQRIEGLPDVAQVRAALAAAR